MPEPSYDDSEWPLFRVCLPKMAMSESEFLAYLTHMDELFLRGDPFAVVLDVRDAPPPTPKERQEIARRIRASHARYPARLVAMGIVMSSALERGIFTAINWLAGPAYPLRSFVTTGDAEAWLQQMLQRREDSGADTQEG